MGSGQLRVLFFLLLLLWNWNIAKTMGQNVSFRYLSAAASSKRGIKLMVPFHLKVLKKFGLCSNCSEKLNDCVLACSCSPNFCHYSHTWIFVRSWKPPNDASNH